MLTILDVRKIGHLNIKTKMLDIEVHVLIGWYSIASESERVPTRCFYIKVAYLSYGKYISILLTKITAVQNEVALSYHFLEVVFATTIILIV